MTDRPLVSIVIPTLNEEAIVGSTLDRCREQPPPFELIVADGGSTDDTRRIARTSGARVLNAPQGRGTQLNYGAEHADGDILLFLHADTLLPRNGLAHVRNAIAEPSTTSGTFRLQFDTATPLLRLYAWCTRWPWIRLCFGDRGLFVSRNAFDAVGGYPDWPIFEDLELAHRLNEYGGFRFLGIPVTTSARRFQRNGILWQQCRNLYLWLHYICGTDPEHLRHHYPYPDVARSREARETNH